LRTFTALIAFAALTVSCGSGITWEHREYYPNGQLRVLPGKSVFDGGQYIWEGPWIWFNLDGSIMSDLTGFYEHGNKTRELTERELRAEMQRVENRHGK
jgi:hypothetical protein